MLKLKRKIFRKWPSTTYFRLFNFLHLVFCFHTSTDYFRSVGLWWITRVWFISLHSSGLV